MVVVRLDPGAAYRCDQCGIWWGSQVGARNKTRFLNQLPRKVTQKLSWDDYRGWHENGQNARQCFQCRKLTGKLVYSVN
jgi:hypothetical protein